MTMIDLPALDGRVALGFLAACGTQRLLEEHASIEAPTLSWDTTRGTARLGTAATLDVVIDLLVDIARSVPDGALLPEGPADFPQGGGGSDPMRMDRSEFRSTVDGWRKAYRRGFVDRWVPAMVTDQSTDDRGRVDVTTFAAPSGQQKFRTMFERSLDQVRDRPELIREALCAWRRYDGISGEYLDHRVLRSAADTSSGQNNEAGVPGATWLALMALPWFPAAAHATHGLSTGWQRHRRGQRNIFVWPLWHAPLRPAGVRTIITHPALRLADDSAEPTVDGAQLRSLSIFTVCGATRQPQRTPSRKFAGVLGPIDVAVRTHEP